MTKVLTELFDSTYPYKWIAQYYDGHEATFVTDSGLKYNVKLDIIGSDRNLIKNVEFGVLTNKGGLSLKKTSQHDSIKIFSTVMKIIKDSHGEFPYPVKIDGLGLSLKILYEKIAKRYSRKFGFKIVGQVSDQIILHHVDEDVESLIDTFMLEARTRAERYIPVDDIKKRVVKFLLDQEFIEEIYYAYEVDDGIEIQVKGGLYRELIEDLERTVLRKTGWHVGAYYEEPHSTRPMHFTLFLGREQRFEDKPPFLYHATSSDLEDVILKGGLKPQSKSNSAFFRYIKGRIYFLKHPLNRHLINEIMIDRRIRKYTVFEFDTSKFKKFNLFVDPAFGELAVYTNSHIPAHALKVLYRKT